MASGDLPAGVRRRHARGCPAAATDDLAVCRCRPSYQAQAGPRRARLTRTLPTLAAARSWKRDTDRAFERGELTGRRAPTVRDAALAWLAAAEQGVALARGDQPYRPSTLRGYRRCMEAELFPVLGTRRLDRVARRDLGELVMALAARGLAASTIRNVVIPLRALYRHAIYLEQVTVNPTVGLKVPAGSGRRMNVLAPAEIPGALAALDRLDRPLWATAIFAGLRRGELMALRWCDVDLAAGVIRVELSYDPAGRRTGPVKSEAGQGRRIPVTGGLRDLLVEHRQRADARAHGLVFARGSLGGARRGHRGPPDGPFSDQAVGERARRAWARAGVRPVGLHDCRHTFASLAIAAMAQAGTFNPKAIQSMLGHASIQQTYDRYGHLFPGAEEEAGRMLDRFLTGSTGAGELAAAAARLVGLLDDADPQATLPMVTDLQGQLASWLDRWSALPSVTVAGAPSYDRQVVVQRADARRVR
jgi:integrase